MAKGLASIVRALNALVTYKSSHPDYKDNDDSSDAVALVDLVADLMRLARNMGESPVMVMREAMDRAEER